MLKEEEKKRIIEIMNHRIGHFSCPICHKGHFSLVDGYSSQGLSEDYKNVIFASKVIPYVMLVCDNCGFVSHHALGTLGLLNKAQDNNASVTSKEDSIDKNGL